LCSFSCLLMPDDWQSHRFLAAAKQPFGVTLGPCLRISFFMRHRGLRVRPSIGKQTEQIYKVQWIYCLPVNNQSIIIDKMATNLIGAKVYENLNVEWYASSSLDEVLVHFFYQIKLNYQQTCPTMLHCNANFEASEQVEQVASGQKWCKTKFKSTKLKKTRDLLQPLWFSMLQPFS